MTPTELANRLDDLNAKIWTSPNATDTERLKAEFLRETMSHFNLLISALREMKP